MKNEIRTMVAIPDVHLQPSVDGVKPIDRHDPKALSVLFQILEYIKPDVVVQGGDLLNLGEMNPFGKKRGMNGKVRTNDGEYKQACLKDSMEAGRRFWDYVREICPRAEMCQLEGNHELWLREERNYPHNQPFVNSDWYIDKGLGLTERKIKFIPFERWGDRPQNWYQFGKLKVLHGWYHGKTYLDQMYLALTGSFLQFDMHVIATKDYNSVAGDRVGMCGGCLCTREASYHRGRLNGWGQAVNIINLLPSGRFFTNICRIVDGEAVIGHKVFRSRPIRGLE